MTIGTKSVLYGAHCFFLHPFFVAWGWTKLYGFPWDPRLWVAFFVHDLGYIGKPNMDGPEGETHPILGARVMSALFDRREPMADRLDRAGPVVGAPGLGPMWLDVGTWGRFSLYHSRFYARRHGAEPSRLCYADKLAIVLTPGWLYVPMATVSGEIREYMDPALHENSGKYEGERHQIEAGPYVWHRSIQTFLEEWVAKHG